MSEYILLGSSEAIEENEFDVEVAFAERVEKYRNTAALECRNMIVDGGIVQGVPTKPQRF